LKKIKPKKQQLTKVLGIYSYGYNDFPGYAEMLIHNGADINSSYFRDRTVFRDTISKDKLEFAQMLIAHGADLNQRNKLGRPPLVEAKYKSIDVLINAGANLEAEDKFGNTPLMVTLKEGPYYEVEILLKRGANPNHKNKNGDTPLHFAKGAFITLLLKYGAEINFKNKYGDTPLIKLINTKFKTETDILYDAESSRLCSFKFLLDKGANVNLQNKRGETALMIAAKNFDWQLCKLLLEYNANLNIQNKRGQTVLHNIVGHPKHSYIFQSDYLDFLNCNFDFNLKDSHGRTALMYMSEKNFSEELISKSILKSIVNNKLNLNIQNKDGDTFFMLAVKECNIQRVEFLLNFKDQINFSILNKHGESAIDLLCENVLPVTMVKIVEEISLNKNNTNISKLAWVALTSLFDKDMRDNSKEIASLSKLCNLILNNEQLFDALSNHLSSKENRNLFMFDLSKIYNIDFWDKISYNNDFLTIALKNILIQINNSKIKSNISERDPDKYDLGYVRKYASPHMKHRFKLNLFFRGLDIGIHERRISEEMILDDNIYVSSRGGLLFLPIGILHHRSLDFLPYDRFNGEFPIIELRQKFSLSFKVFSPFKFPPRKISLPASSFSFSSQPTFKLHN
jgi:ankyrin repeat protein